MDKKNKVTYYICIKPAAYYQLKQLKEDKKTTTVARAVRHAANKYLKNINMEMLREDEAEYISTNRKMIAVDFGSEEFRNIEQNAKRLGISTQEYFRYAINSYLQNIQ